MNPATLSMISILVGIGAALSGVALGWVGRAKSNKQETQEAATENANLRTDVKYIRQSVDEIKADYKEHDKEFDALNLRVTRVEESTKNAHKRISELSDKK